ncbi:MAG: hypothetical protein ACK52I_05985 [Pseudomonadota bacterium]
MAVVRILGIDPGTQVVGFACLELDVGPAPGPAAGVPIALRGSNVVRVGNAASGDLRLLEAGVFRLGGRNVELPRRLLRAGATAAQAPGDLPRRAGAGVGSAAEGGAAADGGG